MIKDQIGGEKMKKPIIDFLIMVLILLGVYYFIQKDNKEPEKEENELVTETLMDESEISKLQQTFHNDGLGFIQHMYSLNEKQYLVYSGVKNPIEGEETLGNQLIWVEKKGKEVKVTPLTNGDYDLHLVMNKEKPFFLAKGQFVFVYYEDHGTKDMPINGKGYVYQVSVNGELEKTLETEGVFHDFYLDEKNEVVFVEKIEKENRNLFPSYFAPYELHYKMIKNKQWETNKTETVEPDIKEEYDKYKEKYESKK